MRLLDRYLLRELLIPFAYCLGGFLIFWMSSDVFTELSNFQRLRLEAGDVVEYYGLKSAEFLVMVLPMGFLLGLLYTLTNLARHHELTAMRAAGLGLGRIALPYLGLGLLLSLGSFALNELWVPQCLETAEQVLLRRLAGRDDPKQRHLVPNLGFTLSTAAGERKWLIEAYHLYTHEMTRPHLVWRLPDGSVRELLAERGAWVDGMWVFTNAVRYAYLPGGDTQTQEELSALPLPDLTETPAQIRSEIRVNKIKSPRAFRKAQLSIREIIDYQRLHPPGGDMETRLNTLLHGRMAAPWTCLVVVAIALPFGAATGRRNVYVGVASSIVTCFAYFVLVQLAQALGAGGGVPPWLAAWLPNILFASGGIAMMRAVR